ncbi:MAG: ACP S-malonyltransferase [Gammaproteobacteria bacterium]|nr:ACP S-malonyltransferase [Gammaproteobacteria bacterium]MDX5374296.1 ACP S-malonyltransferase [Gammaproteobacteria bacterium]
MTFAAVFPGQGSQSMGMLAELGDKYYQVRETFQEASDALGFDLWSLTQNGPESELNSTENTQPAMLAAGVAVWRVWKAQGGCLPQAMAGHSLGEYTALVCAGAMEFDAAVTLVRERGRLMQAAVPEGQGAMAAILGLADDAVQAVCEGAAQGEVVEAVNFNSPGQVVIAGSAAAVERAVAAASEAGAKRALKLPVSVPSHCSLMRSAGDQLAERLAGVAIQAPSIPVIHNADVASHDEPDRIRDALARQLYSPVRWVETVNRLAADGVTDIVEFGPGKVLAGLTKRIDKSISAQCVLDATSLASALGLCGEKA